MYEKILIADDHTIVRIGLSMIIKKNYPGIFIQEVADYISLIEAVKVEEFGLIILDINMPNGHFQGTIDFIKQRQPQVKVLIFSYMDENLYALRYLKAGADGFLHKYAAEGEVLIAIQKIYQSGKYLSETLKDDLVNYSINKEKPFQNPLLILSDREIEIAGRLIKGESLKIISGELNIHNSTISTYKTRIFDKLHINTLPELIEIFKLYKGS